MPALEPVDQSVQAYEWMTNIATAAALVAGASLASLFDHGLHVDLAKCKMIGGPRVARLAHHLRMFSSVLLSLSFAFEIVVVFVATVTGTMLLSGGQRLVHPFDPFAISATHLLHRELEFEYILIRAGFFQGLLNWLIAIGFRFLVSLMTPPDAVEVDKVDKLNQIPDTPALARKRLFLGVGLMLTMFGLVCFMLAFYNYHLNFYANYVEMLSRLGELAWRRYFFSNRVMPWIGIALLSSAGLALASAFALPVRGEGDLGEY